MLSFRDETTAVSYKAQRGKSGASKASDESPGSSTPPEWFLSQDHDFIPVNELSLDINFVAMSHFLDHYMTNTAFSYLTTHWSSVADQHIVQTAVLPVAIAALSHSLKHPQLLDQARNQYSIALSATNDALSKPEWAIRNSTLLSILLLAMYEALTFRGHKSPRNWIMHVNGLATVLKLREQGACHDEFGEKLTLHAGNHIMSNCAQQSIPIPRHVQGFQQRRLTTLGPHTLPGEIGNLIEEVAILSTNIKGMSATNSVIECLRLDCITETAMRRLRITSPYTVLPKTGILGLIYGDQGHVHQYSSQNAARQWNNMRAIRLVLHEWIYRTTRGGEGCATGSPSPQDPLFDIWDQLPKRALLDFEKTLGDILASIPYSRGYLGSSYTSSTRFLVWPLSKCASSELCSAQAREFIIKCLTDIGLQDNSEPAKEAAIMLQEGVPIEDW